MIKKSLHCLLMVAAALCSCQGDTEEKKAVAEPPEEAPLRFQTEMVERRSSLCGESEAGCSTAKVSYLVAQQGNPALRDSLNAFIQHTLLQMQLGQNPDNHVKPAENAAAILAQEFIKDQEDYVASLDGDIPATAAWYLEVAATPIYQTENVVTLQLENSNYTGGAHGNTYINLQSFNGQGKHLNIGELIKDTLQLQRLAEQQLRREYDFIGDKTFEEAGLFIETDQLPLPQEIGLTEEGLLLLYNNYEIGPYALGIITITVPYTQLGQLLPPQYLPQQSKQADIL